MVSNFDISGASARAAPTEAMARMVIMAEMV